MKFFFYDQKRIRLKSHARTSCVHCVDKCLYVLLICKKLRAYTGNTMLRVSHLYKKNKKNTKKKI